MAAATPWCVLCPQDSPSHSHGAVVVVWTVMLLLQLDVRQQVHPGIVLALFAVAVFAVLKLTLNFLQKRKPPARTRPLRSQERGMVLSSWSLIGRVTLVGSREVSEWDREQLGWAVIV